jgi:hypothetical protein
MLSLALAIALLTQGGTPQGSGAVTGRLHFTGTTGSPIVRVAAIPAETGVPAADSILIGIAASDASGNFRLEDVPPGRYYILAGLLAAPTYYPGVTRISDARVVTVTAGSVLTGVDFALQNSATEFVSANGRLLTRIQGVVLTNNGKAIPPLLSVFAQQSNGGSSLGIRLDGRFQLQLARGEYTVGLTNVSARYAVESISYGSVDLLNAPLKIDGSTPATIRITLKEVDARPVFKVSGRLISTYDSYWLRRPMIRLRPDVDPHTSGPYPEGLIDLPMAADGTFEIADVAPGRYLLIPLVLPVAGVQATPITVEDRDLKDVEVPLPLFADIIVHVRFIDENENVLPNPADYNTMRMELRNPRYAGGSGLRALVPEGSYSVSLTTLPSGYVLKSITSGGRDLSQSLLDIDLSAATKIDIEATLQLQKR